MNAIYFLAKIRCLEAAHKFFKFPITNSFRQSFWLENTIASTPAEIQLQGENIDILVPCIVQIGIIDRDFLQGKIEIGKEFTLGTYPIFIASGKILELLTIE